MIRDIIVWIGSVLGFGRLVTFSNIRSLPGLSGDGTEVSDNARGQVIKLHIEVDNALNKGDYSEAWKAWRQANRILVNQDAQTQPEFTGVLEHHKGLRNKIRHHLIG